MKQTGKAEAAFQDSEYAVSDDKSPNIHTRQVTCRPSLWRIDDWHLHGLNLCLV